MAIDDKIRDEKLQNDIKIEQAKFTYSPLGKALKKKKKQVGALKSLNLSNETNELKKIEIIFPKTS